MKRLLSFALLLSLSLALFAACGPAKVPAAPISTEGSTTGQPDGTETVTDGATAEPMPEQPQEPSYRTLSPSEEASGLAYQPYRLNFESLGNGTCRVIGIELDDHIEQDFILVIPDVSPNGDRVTEIAGGLIPRLFPRWIAAERFEKLILDPARAATSNHWANYIVVHYDKKDLSAETDETVRAELLNLYPAVGTEPIYVFDVLSIESEENALQFLIGEHTQYSYVDLFWDCRETGYRFDRLYFIDLTHVISIRLPKDATILSAH